MAALFFLILSWSLLADVTAEECKCPHIDTHYRELGCTPVVVGSGCCPERFDCSHLQNRAMDKCYINESVYEADSSIMTEDVNSDCSFGCFCRMGYPSRNKALITCGQRECFERSDPNCLDQFNLDGCCRFRQICDAAEIAKLDTCELDGKVYREGERMYPKSTPCKKCVCQTGFTGKLESPFCKTFSCGTQIFHGASHREFCAPIYLQETCCPYEWRCHKNSDVITPGPNSGSTDDPTMMCKFGTIYLNVGDTFESDQDCLTCGCFIPPLASCIRDTARCHKKTK